MTGRNFGFNAPGLKLDKKVRNCTAVAASSCNTAFSATGTGQPGNILEYCIAYENIGSATANTVVLTDLVPSNTTADLSGYGEGKGVSYMASGATTATFLTSAADTDSGALTASQLTMNVGSLAQGGKGQVCFRAKIN